MISLGRINWEIKAALVFAITALVISLLTGFAAGNDLPVVFVRAIVLCIVFGLIGFGSVVALKKYVPEIYDILSSQLQMGSEKQVDTDIDSTGVEPSMEMSADMTDSEGSSESATKEESVPVYDEPPQVSRDYLDSAAPDNAKMGKHILEEKTLKYSPKIMADAVRTMMSKDKD